MIKIVVVAAAAACDPLRDGAKSGKRLGVAGAGSVGGGAKLRARCRQPPR